MFLLDELPTKDVLKSFAKTFPEMEVNTTMACLKLLKVSSVLLKKLDHHFSDYGLSQARFLALVILEREESKQQMPVEISRKMGISKKNTTRLLDFMKEDGLITITPHETDGRATIVKITSKGSKALKTVLPGYYKIMNDSMKNVPEKSKTFLINVLSSIEDELKK